MGPGEVDDEFSRSSSSESVPKMAISMSVIFSPTKESDHVKTFMKLVSQKGCGVLLSCPIFITLFSYFSTAALLLYISR